VAVWVIDPVGDYESWRGTLFGLGKDDDQRRVLGVERYLVAGVRAARSQPVAGGTLRIELVQWASLTGERHAGEPGSAAPAAPGAPSAGSSPPGAARNWGGAVLRIGI